MKLAITKAANNWWVLQFIDVSDFPDEKRRKGKLGEWNGVEVWSVYNPTIGDDLYLPGNNRDFDHRPFPFRGTREEFDRYLKAFRQFNATLKGAKTKSESGWEVVE